MQALLTCRRGRRARWWKKQTKRSATSRENGRDARRALGFPLLQRHDSGFLHVFIRTTEANRTPRTMKRVRLKRNNVHMLPYSRLLTLGGLPRRSRSHSASEVLPQSRVAKEPAAEVRANTDGIWNWGWHDDGVQDFLPESTNPFTPLATPEVNRGITFGISFSEKLPLRSCTRVS